LENHLIKMRFSIDWEVEIKALNRKLFKVFLAGLICIFILEAALQLAGFVYTRWLYKPPAGKTSSGPSLNIMFIGDSWTAGADATPEPGFAPRTILKLNQLVPDKNFIEYNFAWGGTNSSQAIHQFFDYYDSVNPEIVVVLTGANNGWNTRDVASAQRRLDNAIAGKSTALESYLGETIVNSLKNLKLFKLYMLIKHNPIKVENTLYNSYSDDFSRTYFDILAEDRDENAARDHLLNNYRKDDHDYLNFFKLVMHSYRGDIDATISCLEENNLWNPRELKGKFNIEENKCYRNQSTNILEKNLTGLKEFCDSRGITLIIQNYPHLHLEFRSLNQSIGKIAEKLEAVYVDHDQYFEETIGEDEWERVSTQGHVNARGHAYMADNLTGVLSQLIGSEN
jgi:GDSL-like Lipase/Acylhydrolase family